AGEGDKRRRVAPNEPDATALDLIQIAWHQRVCHLKYGEAQLAQTEFHLAGLLLRVWELEAAKDRLPVLLGAAGGGPGIHDEGILDGTALFVQKERNRLPGGAARGADVELARWARAHPLRLAPNDSAIDDWDSIPQVRADDSAWMAGRHDA